MRISANGGTPESLVKSKPVNSGNRTLKDAAPFLFDPQILPDGKSVLYTATNSSFAQPRIMVQSLKSGELKELFAGSILRYLPTGHIVYWPANSDNLFAIPFDLDRLEVKGGPVPVIEGVQQAAISDSGTLVYIPETSSATASDQRTLVWIDRNGKEEPLGAPPNVYMYPKTSPDGTRVALTIRGANVDIWVWGLIRKTLTRLTFDEKAEIQSIWTPDSKQIVFASGETIPNDVCWKAADGTGGVERLGSASDLALMPMSFSSDGKTLVVSETDVGTKWDIGILSMEGDHPRKSLLHEKHLEIQPKVSPDGRWMAYTSDESGRNEVYVRPYPEVDKGKWQASTGSGNAPLWSPDGRELFYLSEENSVMAIAVETKPTFSLGTPKILFRSMNIGSTPGEGTPWDISADGKRFLMMKPPGAAAPAADAPRPKINIVVNWFEELKQRVPVK